MRTHGRAVALGSSMFAALTLRSHGDQGFSLLEAVVATGIVAVAVSALAQVVAFAVLENVRARQATVAPILAQQKLEELLSRAAISALGPSPAGTLEDDADGYCDVLDRQGRVLAVGPRLPPGSAYRRRWSVDPLAGSPGRISVVQVTVTDLVGGAQSNGAASSRQPRRARLVSAIAGGSF